MKSTSGFPATNFFLMHAEPFSRLRILSWTAASLPPSPGGSSGSIPDRNKRPVLISSTGRLLFDNCFH